MNLLERFKLAREKATAGEWSQRGPGGDLVRTNNGNGYGIKSQPDDAEFICLAANDGMKLVQALEIARKELKFLGFDRPNCTGYGCCAKCGEIYSAEEAFTAIEELLK